MKYTHFFLMNIFIIPSLSYGMNIHQKDSITVINLHHINNKATRKIKTISLNNNKKKHRIRKSTMVSLDPEGITIIYDPYTHKAYSRS